MAMEGVDYAWSRPDIGQLAAAGKRFACRYGGPGSSGKQLDPAEARALSAAGIAIVANAEGAADGLLGGWSAGVAWASDAEAHFRACGMPPDRPIYLSVDFDVQSGQWGSVAGALRGAASVLGAGRVGVYGGRRAIEWARRDGVARWFWQTYAWSSGVWVPGNHIEQYRNGVYLAGATLDLNRAHPSDFGQWMIGDDMTPEQDQILRGIAQVLGDAAYRVDGIWAGTDLRGGRFVNDPTLNRNMLKAQIAEVAADVEELKARPPVQPAPVDPATLKAVLLDPQVLAAIAKAVADEEHRRLDG